MVEKVWYEDDRDYRLERLQDRLDRYVAAMASSPLYQTDLTSEIIECAIDIIRYVDEAARKEVDHEDK